MRKHRPKGLCSSRKPACPTVIRSLAVSPIKGPTEPGYISITGAGRLLSDGKVALFTLRVTRFSWSNLASAPSLRDTA